MAFTVSGPRTGAELIRTVYQAGFVDAVYRNNELLSLFPPATPYNGDTNFRWKVNSAGNTSVEVFTEGQAEPTAGNQQWVSAAVAPVYFRGMVQVTGHARDAMLANYVDGIEQEMVLVQQDIIDLMTTTFMGSTNSGLEVAIDSTTTYAGIARGSAAYFESTETAVSAALAYNHLLDLEEAIRDNDKGGSPSLILMPWNQNTNLWQLGGAPGFKMFRPEDAAAGFTAQTWNGKRVVPLGDFTDTVIMMLDMSPGQWEVKTWRPFQVKEDDSGDSKVYAITTALTPPICRSPKRHGKLTGVTA